MPRRKPFMHPDNPTTRVIWLMLAILGLEVYGLVWVLMQQHPLN